MSKSIVPNLLVLFLSINLALAAWLHGEPAPRPLPLAAADRDCFAAWGARLENPDTCFAVKHQLIASGEAAMPLLLTLLEAGSTDAKIEAAISLGMMRRCNRARAIPGLIRLLQGNDTDAQRIAVETLGSIGPAARGAVPDLQRILLANKACAGGLVPADRYVPMAVARIQGADAVPILLKWLHLRPDLCVEIAEALARTGPSAAAAIPLIEDTAQQQGPNIRRAAERAVNELRRQAIGTTAPLETCPSGCGQQHLE